MSMEEKILLTEEEKLERVERLKQKTFLTYEEVRDALEANNWDMLEAMIYLERLGMVKGPGQPRQSTEEEKTKQFKQASEEYEKHSAGGFGDTLGKFFKWCGKIIKLGCENTFRIRRNSEEVLNMPILVLIILVCSFFWVVVPLLVVGIFFRFQYSFCGSLFEGEGAKVNEACDKMADACETIKKEFADNEEAREER